MGGFSHPPHEHAISPRIASDSGPLPSFPNSGSGNTYLSLKCSGGSTSVPILSNSCRCRISIFRLILALLVVLVQTACGHLPASVSAEAAPSSPPPRPSLVTRRPHISSTRSTTGLVSAPGRPGQARRRRALAAAQARRPVPLLRDRPRTGDAATPSPTEDPVPVAEHQVAGHHHRVPRVALGEPTEQHLGLLRGSFPRPRARGRPGMLFLVLRDHGSSPRVRGRVDLRDSANRGVGFIPAWAGGRQLNTATLLDVRVHPRARGGAMYGFPVACCLEGASPRARGSLDRTRRRSIAPGSSPRLRGQRQPAEAAARVDRCIPAHAGASSRWPGAPQRPKVHPRARGGNVFTRDPFDCAVVRPRPSGAPTVSWPGIHCASHGSSPRVRGYCIRPACP